MRSLIASIALLALAAPASAQDAPYPSLEILDAFRDGCGSIADQPAASASLSAAGWQIVDPSAAPAPLTEFTTFAREAGGRAVAAQGGTMSEMEVFEKTVAGERLFTILSEVRIEGARVTGCRLFDFGETRKIGVATAQEWLGREPIKILDQDEVHVADWEPGTLPGHDSFQLFFVPTDSPLKQIFKFDGVALKSDSVGIDE